MDEPLCDVLGREGPEKVSKVVDARQACCYDTLTAP
jgi:hypothetical protein